MPPLYVGIDAGGTGTRAAVASEDGAVLAHGLGGPSGTSAGTQLRSALRGALTPLLPAVAAHGVRLHLGMRGTSVARRIDVAAACIAELLPNAELSISNDAAIALEGALLGEPGVAVLAGTGSIALARRADGVEFRAGGFGYLVGDEGGGYWLAREAIAAVLRSVDGRGPSTPLAQLLPRAVGLGSAAELVPWLYAKRTPVPAVAALAPLVTQAAQADDLVALDILGQAARALADLAVGAARKAWPDGAPASSNVARCGQVWNAGPLLIDPFDAALGKRSIPPRLPPVGGALLRAGLSPAVVEVLRLGLFVD
jgi:N-acetylglucosamine kinase-like BadF-type ATPase